MAPELSPAPEPARVMIVEDEVLIRLPIAEALRAVGLEVIEASNADEAWSYLLSGQAVDLIFSDIQMPGSMDGIELTRQVQERFGHIIIVLTSGRRSRRITDHQYFLAKPYRLGNVTALITSLLENNKRIDR
jgi:CheY-like chemotaxis protein